MKVLEKHRIPPSTPRYRHLFVAILEAYLARCVGAPPINWAPIHQSVHCSCRICSLVNHFLASSVSAASFTSISDNEAVHIKTFLMRCTGSFPCQITVEDDLLVIRKEETIDSPSWRIWAENNRKATVELGKLDGPALRSILGDDFHLIFDFESAQLSKKRRPIPIESLEEASEEGCSLATPEVPTLTPPSTLRGSGSSWSKASAGSLLALPSTTSRPNSANGHALRGDRINAGGRKPPSPPATSPIARPGAVAGYNLFASELGERLRYLYSFWTSETIQDAIVMRWKELSDMEREVYDARAVRNQILAGTPAPSTPVPFDLHKDRLPSTPKPSPWWGPVAASSPAFNGSPEPGSGRAKPKCTWRGARPSPPTPQAFATGPASSPSPRVLGSISSSRLNAIPLPRGEPKIKTEAPPQGTSRGAKRTFAEVIDLTEDN